MAVSTGPTSRRITTPADYYAPIMEARSVAGSRIPAVLPLQDNGTGGTATTNGIAGSRNTPSRTGGTSQGGLTTPATTGTAPIIGTTSNSGGTTYFNPSDPFAVPTWTNPTANPVSQTLPNQTNGQFTSMNNNDFWNMMGPWAWQNLQNQMNNGMLNTNAAYQQSRNSNLDYMNTYTPQSLTEPLITLLNQMSQGVQGNALTGSTLSDVQNNGGQYGAQALLQQIMQYGLPNQQNVESLTTNQMGLGERNQGTQNIVADQVRAGGQTVTPFQQSIQDQLGALIQGGGLSPEYTQAMREQVLAPSQEALTGRLNQMSGGGADLSSPAYQEMLRRNEKDFNNQLITTGANNLQNYLSQGQVAGATGFGQGMNVANLYGGMANQALGTGLQGFNAVSQNTYPYVNTATNAGLDTSRMAQQQQVNTGNLGSNVLNQNMGFNLGTTDQALRQYLGQLGAYSGMTNSLVGANADMARTQYASDAAASAARNQAIGSGVGNAMPSIINLIAGLFGGNSSSGSSGLGGLSGLGGWGGIGSGFTDSTDLANWIWSQATGMPYIPGSAANPSTRPSP